MGHFGLEIIDVSDGTPVFCPPLFLFILFAKRGEKAKARKLPGRREGKLTPTQTIFKGYFGLEIIDASDGTPVFCPPLFLFILFAKKKGRRQKLESCQEEEKENWLD